MSIPWQIQHFEEVSSTNSLLMEAAKSGSPEGLVFVADYQSEGRGKPGNQWISPRGQNLLCSVLLRPMSTVDQAPIITLVTCKSIANLLQVAYGLESSVKLPNDVLVSGKKICGVLTETYSQSDIIQAAVIGIGFNVNATQDELPETATSLKISCGKSFDIQAVLRRILEKIDSDAQIFCH